MANKYNTIVADKDYTTVKRMIKNYCVVLESLMDEYRKCIIKLAEEAVVSGEIHEALVAYISYVKKLNGKFTEVGNTFKNCCYNFVDEIDYIDDYLYEKGEMTVRDFTDQEYRKILQMLESDGNWFQKILDRGEDRVLEFLNRWTDCYDVKKQLNDDLDNAHSALLDLNNANKKKVTGIFEGIAQTENRYGNNFDSKMVRIRDCVYNLKKIISKCSEIVNPENGKFTAENINLELNDLYKQLNLYVNSMLIINDDAGDATIDEIEEFVEDSRNLSPFQFYNSIFSDIISQIGGWDAFNMAFWNKESLVLSSVTDRFSVPLDIASSDVYEYLMIKNNFAEILSNTSKEKVDISKNEEAIKKAKDIMDAILKKKKDYPDYEKYKKIYDSLQDIADGMGYAMDISEILLDSFANYYANSKLIESLAEGVPEETLTARVVKDLMNEYDNIVFANMENVMKYSIKQATQKGIKNGAKIMSKSISELYSTVQFGVDVAGALTGLAGVSDKKLQFIILNSERVDLQCGYEHNFSIVADGSHEIKDINNLKNSFNILKETYIKELDLLAGIAEDKRDLNKKAYYEYLQEQVRNQTMNSGKIKVLTYKEYMNQ